MRWNGPIQRLFKRPQSAIIRQHKRRRALFLSDTTLRDGEQMPGVRLNPDEKAANCRRPWPAPASIRSTPVFRPRRRRKSIPSAGSPANVRGPVINAHCRTLKADIDAAGEALGDLVDFQAGRDAIHRD